MDIILTHTSIFFYLIKKRFQNCLTYYTIYFKNERTYSFYYYLKENANKCTWDNS